MAALYLDEDVPIALADLLRTRGHSASTTRDARRFGSPDPAQLLYAANGGLVLVTHNGGDFARLHDAWLTWARGWGVERAHGGIIALGRVLGKPPEDYADLVADRLAGLPLALADTLHRWHPQLGWTQAP
jgi:hypothetical protein